MSRYMNNDKLIELYNKGTLYKDMRDELGVSHQTLKNRIELLIKEGIIEPRLNNLDDLDENKFIEKYNEGLSYRELGELFNVNIITVSSMVSRLVRKGIIKRKTERIHYNNFNDDIKELWNQGKSYKEISDTLKIFNLKGVRNHVIKLVESGFIKKRLYHADNNTYTLVMKDYLMGFKYKDIAKRNNLSSSKCSRLISDMIAKGYVNRRHDYNR